MIAAPAGEHAKVGEGGAGEKQTEKPEAEQTQDKERNADAGTLTSESTKHSCTYLCDGWS